MKIPQGLSFTEADYRRAEHFGDQETLNAMDAEWNALERDPIEEPPTATARALDAFAADVAGDSAIDSIVYDLQAYDPAVPDADRYAAVTREGIFGLYADPDVANMAVVNRRAMRTHDRIELTAAGEALLADATERVKDGRAPTYQVALQQATAARDAQEAGELTEEQYEKSFGMPTDEGGSR